MCIYHFGCYQCLQEDEDLQQLEVEGPGSEEDEAEAMDEDGRMPGTDLALYGG